MTSNISEPHPPDAPVILWVLALPAALVAVTIVIAWTTICVVLALALALSRAVAGLFRPPAAPMPPAPPIGPTAGKSAPQEL